MLKKILNLKGVYQLSKDEQSEYLGGGRGGSGCCDPAVTCCVPQPIPSGCTSCANPAPGCQFAYGTYNCPNPVYASCCI